MSVLKLSIITPSLNRVEMLRAAVQSVVTQGYPHYEHIIVDGGSTDGTLEFVRTQPQIKFVCEPDRGMYDALNKGLALANGEVVGFLNTDDLYAEGIFNTVMKVFEDASVMAVAGGAEVFFDNTQVSPGIKLRYSPKDKSVLESTTISGNYFNAWFFRKEVFDMVGGFNAAYTIVGDRDFMLRVALHKVPYTTIDRLAYLYRSHTGSLTFDISDYKREVSSREILEMTLYYLHHGDLAATEKRLIAKLHTQESLALARRYENTGDMSGYFSILIECIKYDPFSLPRVLRHVMRSAITQFVRVARLVIQKFMA